MDEATRISLKDQFNSLLVRAIEGRRGGMALMRVLEELDFYNSPASAKHHLNVPGGLVMHSLNVARAALELCDKMDETFGTWESDFSSFIIWMKLRKNFNPPVRWEAMQDKRRNPKPLGRNTYLYKARKIKSLARSTHTRVSLHKGKQKGTEEQCKHTFKITAARCAPCSGYNVECEHYEKNSAADTKHGSSRT